MNLPLFPAPATPTPDVRPWKRPTYVGDALIEGSYRYWLTRSWGARVTPAVKGEIRDFTRA